MDELTQEFLVESNEGLDRMERCLTELEQRPDDAALLNEIFRVVHTIKGTTGFLALPRVEKIAHAGESLLGLLRDGKLKASRTCIDGMLALLDALRALLREIESSGTEPAGGSEDDAPLLHLLEGLRTGDDAAGAATRAGAAANTVEMNAVAAADNTLRVDVETLNQMLNLVGELVLTRNQIALAAEDEQSQRLAQRLDTVTTDLRESMMRARTQPVDQLFGRLPRIVRDLADRLGKCVRLELAGQETRLDKTLLDKLRDPLVHILRNAVDHGIEPPAERVRQGKALEAAIRVAAFQEGGQVVVELSDDGGGIDTDAVTARAVSRGLISKSVAESLSEEERLKLIFLPGFSTRDEVTVTSGRGVGMDVVRQNVESLGGRVDLVAKRGAGTTVRMRVPLTLAIVPALVVRCGGQGFAFSRADVREMLIVSRHEEHAMVQRMGEALLLRVRGRLIPLVSLCDTLALPRDDARGYYVVILDHAGQRFGVMVDDLYDQQEIVVKPLAQILRSSGLFAGASVLGNGELALIVDTSGLASLANIRQTHHAMQKDEARESVKPGEGIAAKPEMLLYETAAGERIAIPLDAVERIESIAVADVETCDGHHLVQRDRGALLLEGDVQPATEGSDALTVILCRQSVEGGLRRGIVVRRVLDIADASPIAGGGGRLALVRGRLATLPANRDALSGANAIAWKEAA